MGRSLAGRRWAIVLAVALAFAGSASSLRAAAGTIVVPRLSGGVQAAYARLHGAGLLVSLPAWTLLSGASTQVVGAAPQPGVRVVAGTGVRLYLAPSGRLAAPLPQRAARLTVPSFVGQRVSAASRWARAHHLPFLAHLGPLRRGNAPWLLADYVIATQVPIPGTGRETALTVWGRQPAPPPPAPTPPAPPPPSPPTPTPTIATTAAAPPAPPPTYYQNPVYASDFPDPFVLDADNTHSDYWAFSTGNLFPVLHSSDLVHWTAEGTAMSTRPTWVVPTGDWHPWAPSVIQSDLPCPGNASGGCYVMYYVGLSAAFNRHCIGVATSPTPGGPYTDQGPLVLAGQPSGGSTLPLGCGDSDGAGNIDPSPFIDAPNGGTAGQGYLYVSTDNVCTNGSCTFMPTISVIPLTPNLRQASAARVPLFAGDPGTWEAAGTSTPKVEGPSTEFHNGTYYLFYSGGNWQLDYGMGYATGPSPTGPFTKSPGNPILVQTRAVLSPGGGDRLVTGPHGGLWLVYHARAGSFGNPRTLRIDPFSWKPAATAGAPDVPVISGPTATPQSIQP